MAAGRVQGCEAGGVLHAESTGARGCCARAAAGDPCCPVARCSRAAWLSQRRQPSLKALERFPRCASERPPAHARLLHTQDENNLREALKHSAAMLGELRTSLLSPQKYYALYMKTFDELRYLEAFFVEENKRGRSNAELYEIVQHAGNILPRMCVRARTCASCTPLRLRRVRAGTC